MIVHRSNRMEVLVNVLAEVARRPLGGPTRPECIAVQGRGMERWLSMELARRLGIWANPDFPFPRHLIERILAAVPHREQGDSRAFEPEVLLWSIAEVLPEHLGRPEFRPLRNYLQGDKGGLKRVQLAQRIAETFDHYVVYRPDMLLAWERGEARGFASEGNQWQPLLWRALVERHGSAHLAARAQAFLSAVESGARPEDGVLPPRISIFGLSTLPPLYVRVLDAVSQFVEIHLFLLSPSPEYWAEIRSQREIARTLQAQGLQRDAAEKELHLEVGNPLLASLGRLGRDFQRVLESCSQYRDGVQHYEEPSKTSMLGVLQSDILAMQERGSPACPALPLRPEDDSIRIHSCHGPMRELEVLHDQLLDLFDRDGTLEPQNVVVLMPSIDAYAPYIDAVFGTAGTIPYCVADRRTTAMQAVARAFLALLRLLPGRSGAPELLDALALPAVRARFGIAAEDLELIQAWVAATGIRWGADAEHRAEHGQPPRRENTWQFGLDRLLLGYALQGREAVMFGGVLPVDGIEGAAAETTGRLAEFCARLSRYQRGLGEAHRTVPEWCRWVEEVLRDLVAAEEPFAAEHAAVAGVLRQLREEAELAGSRTPVGFQAIRGQVERALARALPARGFLRRGVTFCELVPMRSIPFRVVCLIGMNDGAFPRAVRPVGFDLLAQHPRWGDRSPREDDRYLFLEALLSARERLIITYTGQNIRDNSKLPPSPVVSELLDVLDRSFTSPSGAVRDAVLIEHPLQPFSPRYFDRSRAGRLFSFSQPAFRGAQALVAEEKKEPSFWRAGWTLSDPEPPEVLEVGELVRFFRNPCRYLLQTRLGIFLDEGWTRLPEHEPLALADLDRWRVGDRLLRGALAGEDRSAVRAALRASGILPAEGRGTAELEILEREVDAMVAAARCIAGNAAFGSVFAECDLGSLRLAGALDGLCPSGRVVVRFQQGEGPWELGLWIEHLLWNASLSGIAAPRVTYWIGRGNKGRVARGRFREVGNARELLSDLLELYRAGCSAPLPFLPRAARVYAERWHRSRHSDREARHAEAMRAARVVLDPDHAHEAREAADPYVRLIFGERRWLDEWAARSPRAASKRCPAPEWSFADVARRVFGPLLEHRDDL